MVSLSSYCQYPTVKVINNDSVVIMTLKQAQEINVQFTSFKESLATKDKTIIELKSKIGLLEKSMKDSTEQFNSKLSIIFKQNDFLVSENKRIEKKIWSDKRERRFTAIGFVAVITGWLTFFALSN